jgi:SHS2 domain-containing protein
MIMKVPSYTLVDHTADLGIQIQAPNLEELFINAGIVLMDLLLKRKTWIQNKSPEPVTITLNGIDIEDLMVRWLGEILYIFEAEQRVVLAINIETLNQKELKAQLTTIPFDDRSYEINHEIKAITYHQIKVAPKGKVWEARVIFDL